MARNVGEARQGYEVILVGAGTTGLAVARLLDRCGLRIALVDPARIVCHHPRASHLDDECMRLLQTLGFTEAQMDYMVQTGVDVFGKDGELLITWDMATGETDQGWQSDYQFFQPDVEARLRGQLAASPGADLWLGWSVTDLQQDDQGVLLTVQNRKTGAVRSIRSAWVVACDGANSDVRDFVPHSLRDLGGTQRSVIIDVQKFAPVRGLPESKTYIRSGARPFTHQPTMGDISRFQFMLIGDEDLDSFEDPEMVYELLAPHIAPDEYRILRTDVYEWHARLLEGWRSDHVLIAGDAAHQMPPMLGQGMCSGLRDAANLAWKLAMVVRGTADAHLLDTYESERRPHVEAMIHESVRQARLIAAAGRGEAVSASGAVDRTHAPLGTGLGTSHPLRGTLSPQPRDSAGLRLDDAVGYNFAVLGLPEVLGTVDQETRDHWQRVGAVVLADLSPDLTAWLTTAGADAAIVRPDRYVFALTSGADELATASATLVGQLDGRLVAR